MSFGFGVGDFIAVAELAFKCYELVKDGREGSDIRESCLNSLRILEVSLRLTGQAISRLHDGMTIEDRSRVASSLGECGNKLRTLVEVLERYTGLPGSGILPRLKGEAQWAFSGKSETLQIIGNLVTQATLFSSLLFALSTPPRPFSDDRFPLSELEHSKVLSASLTEVAMIRFSDGPPAQLLPLSNRQEFWGCTEIPPSRTVIDYHCRPTFAEHLEDWASQPDLFTSAFSKVASPDFGLLRCVGISRKDRRSHWHILYDIPDGFHFSGFLSRRLSPHTAVDDGVRQDPDPREQLLEPLGATPSMDYADHGFRPVMNSLRQGFRSAGRPVTLGIHKPLPSIVHEPMSAMPPQRLLITYPEEFEASIFNFTHAPLASVGQRVGYAICLAKAVFYIHRAGFLHKRIRSENVGFLKAHMDGNIAQEKPFLTDFQATRPEAAHSVRLATSNEANRLDLYLHRDRRSLFPKRASMEHDIYALGVVLIELGMWRLVDHDHESGVQSVTGSSEEGREDPAREALIYIARRVLPTCMGSKYAHVVIRLMQPEKAKDANEDVSVWFMKRILELGSIVV